MMFALLVWSAYGTPTPPPPSPSPPVVPDPAVLDAAALEAATTAGKAFGAALKGRLETALASGGPPEGIRVCHEVAAGLASTFGADHGVTVGRASLRTRNPENKGPDWVQQWLSAQGERKAEGVGPHREVVETPDGRVARVILPIRVEPVCLACHGPAATLPEPVRTALAAQYPQDAAVGYTEGDLRGALWVERPVGSGGNVLDW
jgi:hypothetical protein